MTSRLLLPVACVVAALLASCDSQSTPTATFISPALGSPCQFYDCGSHGTCQADAGVGPACACDDGFTGERCEQAICFAGFHWDSKHECVPNQTCVAQPQNPCGQHGVCDDSDGIVACVCEGGYQGAHCTLCASGYGRDPDDRCLQLVIGPTTSASALPICAPDTCNSHGQCSDASGSARCKCDAGYAGTRCASCDSDSHRDLRDECVPNQTCASAACGAHGSCDATTGVALCQCENGYSGNACERCGAGFHDAADAGTTSCMLDDKCLATSCDGHGACTDVSGVVQCICNANYAGTHCDKCSAGNHTAPDGTCVKNEVCTAGRCGSHAGCDASSGVVICHCDAGYTGTGCGVCAAGFHADGSGGCAVDQQCQPNTCPPHATCSASSGVVLCTCATGYQGSACDGCAQGFHAVGSLCAPVDCAHAPACAPHSQCSDQSGSPACVCDANYAGATCDHCVSGYHLNAGACVKDVDCLPASCPTHSTCDGSSGAIVCTCTTGYQGSACDTCAQGFRLQAGLCVPGDCAHAPACGPNSQCVDQSGYPVCVCSAGYTGTTCNLCAAGYHAQATACVRDTTCQANTCNLHGTCLPTNNQVACVCASGYAGAACDACASGFGPWGATCHACATGPVTFDALGSFPAAAGACTGTTMLQLEGVTFTSSGGTGMVQECGPNTLYFSNGSRHIALEAGATLPAELAFNGPIGSLTFDYAARNGPIDLEVLGDGKVLESFSQYNNGAATHLITLSSPIVSLKLRSRSGGTAQIALDNITYQLAVCTP